MEAPLKAFLTINAANGTVHLPVVKLRFEIFIRPGSNDTSLVVQADEITLSTDLPTEAAEAIAKHLINPPPLKETSK